MAKWNNGRFKIDEFVRQHKGDLAKTVRFIGLELYSRVVLRSPVDTGRFRGNWMLDIGAIPVGGQVPGRGPGTKDGGNSAANGSAAYSLAMRQTVVLQGYKLGMGVHFSNNVPYSVRLEEGYSAQAPEGVVRITAQEFFGVARRAARRARKSS